MSLAAENLPDQTPLIPAGINSALGAIRVGMTIEEVEKEFRVFYPNTRMMEIVGGIGNGNASIQLEVGIEIGLRVRDTSTTDPNVRDTSIRRYWVVADTSVLWIQDFTKRQAIKVELVPITPVASKKAQNKAALTNPLPPPS